MDISSIESHIVKKVVKKEGKTSDHKLIIYLDDGQVLFQRTGPISRYDKFKMMYDALEDLKSLNEPGIPIPYFVNKEEDQAMLMTSYSKGTKLLKLLQDCQDEKAIQLGTKAGLLLQSIHTLSPLVPFDYGDYDIYFKKILSNYVNLSLYLPNEQKIISFILNNMKAVMYERDATYINGNISEETLYEDDKGNVFFVDTCDISSFDPYYDFKEIGIKTCYLNPIFSSAMINAYTNGKPDNDFWLAFAVYSALSLMNQMVTLVKANNKKAAHALFKKVCNDFNDFDESNLVPKWYKTN